MTEINAKNDFTLDIDSLAYGPHGVARAGGRAVFVPLTAPGDKVEARIVAEKGNYAVGEMIRLLDPSPLRQSPPCPYFSSCGGCPWQHVRYEAQLAAKQKNVEDALRRIGKLSGFELRAILGSPLEYRYRRRLRFQVDRRGRLGFYRAASHDLVEIDSCLIGADGTNRHLGPLREWIQVLDSAIEQLEIVVGDEPGQLAVVASAAGDFAQNDDLVCSRFLDRHPAIRGLVVRGRGWRRAWGDARISAESEQGIMLAAEADVFSQVNRDANRRVLHELLELGAFESGDRVLELYCGAGNFTLSMAKRAHEVVAVEGYRPSVAAGKLNAQRNGVVNVRWISSLVPAALERLLKRRSRFSKIVLNPPRGGAKGLERDLASLGADKILYVSCNPATLARDLSTLAQGGYKLARIQPIDLFPHTFHVESVAEMVR